MRPTTMLEKIAAMGFHGFIRLGETVVRVSAEHGDMACEYYGPNGYPYINPKLVALAEQAGGFWEWENPSNIAFYEN